MWGFSMGLTDIKKIAEMMYRDFWYQVHLTLGQHPSLYYALFARRFPFNHMRVTPNTQVCIEGFPRSANSYAVVAFNLANPQISIAHHLHVPAQILEAVQQNIPTVLVIRHPRECVASFMVFQRSERPAPYLKAYIRFHQALLPVMERVVVADFNQVVTNINVVIEALNSKFNTRFQFVENLPEQKERIFSRLEAINRQFFKGDQLKSMKPDEHRRQLKIALQDRIEAHRLFPEALALYMKFRKYSSLNILKNFT